MMTISRGRGNMPKERERENKKLRQSKTRKNGEYDKIKSATALQSVKQFKVAHCSSCP